MQHRTLLALILIAGSACGSSTGEQSNALAPAAQTATADARGDDALPNATNAGRAATPDGSTRPTAGAGGRRAAAGSGGAQAPDDKRAEPPPAAVGGTSAAGAAGSAMDPATPIAGGSGKQAAAGSGADGTDTLNGMGSCCEEHPTPGCGNADIQVCVCEKQPSCCERAWDAACVFIVEQKYCQPGVRECVCGSDTGQWGQTQCCESEWTSSCDSVAEIKCNAVVGCF